MSETKWTKGPWTTLKARTLINIKGPMGEQICQVGIRDEANANLIAAAPEMYEALERALGRFEADLYLLPVTDDYEVSVKKDNLSAIIGTIRVAIRKARGEK